MFECQHTSFVLFQLLTANINRSSLTATCVISIYVALADYVALLLLLYLPFLFLSGMLQMNYEDFCHIATVCTEQIGQKCKRFFSPSNFMKFEKDDSGRIAILPFYLYVMRTVSYFLQERVVKIAS
jgi:hypothetical protein